jgi:hypothetical protein
LALGNSSRITRTSRRVDPESYLDPVEPHDQDCYGVTDDDLLASMRGKISIAFPCASP